ncbi:MAG: hypothetical protein RDV48_13605 [Candidatus Eremiobacteraeota bacterium]|nr:hypothetical protein [Candidatus Eremiobacteraeota bacterium]
MGGATNPWLNPQDIVLLKSVMSFLASILFFWVYFRLNRFPLYLYLAIVLVAHAIFFALFFRESTPGAFAFFGGAGLAVAFVGILSAAVMSGFVILNKKLIIMHDGQFLDHTDGSVKIQAIAVVTFVVMIVLSFLFGNVMRYYKGSIPGISGFILFLMALAAASFLAWRLIPLRPLTEGALLGEAKAKNTVENIFQVTTDIGSTEMMLVPIALVAVWGLLLYLVKGTANQMDITGLLILVILTVFIFRSEMKKKGRK